MISKASDRSSVVTVVAIAIVAYACSDTIHEMVGHGLIALLLGIKITSISSIKIWVILNLILTTVLFSFEKNNFGQNVG